MELKDSERIVRETKIRRICKKVKNVARRVKDHPFDVLLSELPFTNLYYAMREDYLNSKFFRRALVTSVATAYLLCACMSKEPNPCKWAEANRNYQEVFRPYGLLDINQDGKVTNSETAKFYDELGIKFDFPRQLNKDLEAFLKDRGKK